MVRKFLVLVGIVFVMASFAGSAFGQETEESTSTSPVPNRPAFGSFDGYTLAFGGYGWTLDFDHPADASLIFITSRKPLELGGDLVDIVWTNWRRDDLAYYYGAFGITAEQMHGFYGNGASPAVRDGGCYELFAQVFEPENREGKWPVIGSVDKVCFGPQISATLVHDGKMMSSTSKSLPVSVELHRLQDGEMKSVTKTDNEKKEGMTVSGNLRFLGSNFLDGDYSAVVSAPGLPKKVVPFKLAGENVDLGLIDVAGYEMSTEVKSVTQESGLLFVDFVSINTAYEKPRPVRMTLYSEVGPVSSRVALWQWDIGRTYMVWGTVVGSAPAERLGWAAKLIIQYVDMSTGEILGEKEVSQTIIASDSGLGVANAATVKPEQKVRVQREKN